VNNGLTNLVVTDLAPHHQSTVKTLYAATQGGGIFRSDDVGDSWAMASAGQPDLQSASYLAVDPELPATAFAVGSSGSLFKTTNGGATWSLVPIPVDEVGVFGVQVQVVAVDPNAPSVLFVSGLGSACPQPCGTPPVGFALRSADGGATWEKLAAFSGVAPSSFTFHFAGGVSTVYASVDTGVLESHDGGTTWHGDQSGLPSLLPHAVLATSLTGTAYVGIPAKGVFANACVDGVDALCLNASRFIARLSWASGSGELQPATASPLVVDTGAFWFFEATNLELVVKVLDGRSINGRFWVFYGSLTNASFTLTLTDTVTGAIRSYVNSQGELTSAADTSAFE
jgi:photosystem II stability/assembly factor-like uncharacterized protein